MADPQPQKSQSLTIPADVASKFGPLIELIKGSESMNNEERQYWVNILPIMTPEQLKNLEDILGNEKKQLAAIDAKYQSATAKAGSPAGADGASVQEIEQRIKNRKLERQKKEQEAQKNEEQSEEQILSQIQQL